MTSPRKRFPLAIGVALIGALIGLSTPAVSNAADATLPLDAAKSFQVTTPGFTNRYIRHSDSLGYTEVIDNASGDLLKSDASFYVRRGLGHPNCYSLESKNYPNEFLRHQNSRVRKDRRDGSTLFDLDATWCAKTGLSGVGVSLESLNYPGNYLRHANAQLYLAPNTDGTSAQDESWSVVDEWAANAAGACNSVDWQRGVYYRLGDVVRFPANGNYYKLVNVGTNGSDATDPTISTWYWAPTSCTGGGDNGGGGGGAGSFAVSEAQFGQMFPARNALYTYSGLTAAAATFPGFATTGSDTVKRQEIAAFLANIAHESDSLKATREYNTANWPLYCDASSGCAPGQQYYGRGPIQLSWNYNYRAAGQALGIDLWANPDLVATDPTIAWRTAVWYWMTGTGAAGTTAHNAMVNGQGFGTTIRALNGSLECNGGRPDQVQARINFYNSFTQIIGVAPGGNLSC